MPKSIFVLTLIVISTLSAFSQTSTKPCTSENHRAFDFWEGDWQVTDTTGAEVGQNRIHKIQDGCALQENWTSKSSTGTSYNYYHATDSTWNQLWIDNLGSQLNLKGHVIENGMVLRSKVLQGQRGKYYHQIAWIKNEDESVTQLWSVYGENGEFRTTLFKGIYRRK